VFTPTADCPPSARHVLLTGGAGFIGTNLAHYWCQRFPADRLVVLDALTYAGNRQNLSGLALRFVQGDIGDRAVVDALLHEEAIDTVLHLAAESHVDRSIAQPDAFIQTNLVGTYRLLEAFRQHWEHRGKPEGDRFLHVSTDEVFGSLEPGQMAFCETTAYAPNSPYAASKAGSDHLVRAYHQTYGLPTLITHCCNNYGPYQHPEKFIPLLCVNILQGKPLPIYGDGQQIRDWIYVGDHCAALEAILLRGRVGQTYAIGGNCEIRNLDLTHRVCSVMDELAIALPVRPSAQLITFVNDRPGHDRRYAINAAKLRTELGWLPQTSLQAGLAQTLQWYLTHWVKNQLHQNNPTEFTEIACNE
jgi:dTDP-glucose 4,6-dehydratase